MMGCVVSKKTGNVLYVQICKGAKLNALDDDIMKELSAIVEKANNDLEIKVVVIKGIQKAFSVGLDVNEFRNISEDKVSSILDMKWQCISNFRMPVIAVVSGFALGGGFELALMCDMIIATDTAKFGFPEVNLGLIPGNGGYQRLSRIVGKSVASYLIFSGEIFDAHKALELHVVSHVIQCDKIDNFIDNFVLDLSRKSRYSLESIKRFIRASDDQDIGANLELTIAEFRRLLLSNDSKKEVERFLNR